jgi:hypothetical protein
MPMQYNQCKTCGANEGRAGNLIDGECLNCHDTRANGAACLHANLRRTDEELKKTFAIIGGGETSSSEPRCSPTVPVRDSSNVI